MKAFVALVCFLAAAQQSQAQLLGMLHFGRSALDSLASGYDKPPYTVVYEGKGYEERMYPSRKWVCTNSTADDEGRITYMFYRLFDYITGANSRGVKIDMTIPVACLVPWGGDDTLRMCFYVPEAFQSSTPTPTDQRVHIVAEPDSRVAVRKFSGYPSLAEWSREAEKLKTSLASDSRLTGYDTSHYLRAGYDAPWKFYNRRNEVLIVSKASAGHLPALP
ncbi:unnamed protein product [Notodromas monacha]|uniref:Heme-binding protein 2 n=1 Tax=Notodromas monacha TaxID=399045 RepID=A0A7R9BV15_9CRUS|nr:unnamed protein product [Notodromas monacha]CAG0922254.1 unnamed protein product [Notodromas monacha]